jgi:hypothetical protein
MTNVSPDVYCCVSQLCRRDFKTLNTKLNVRQLITKKEYIYTKNVDIFTTERMEK